jgi:hypothetical protein
VVLASVDPVGSKRFWELTGIGRYLYRRRELRANPAAHDLDLQDRFLAEAARLTGITLPTG